MLSRSASYAPYRSTVSTAICSVRQSFDNWTRFGSFAPGALLDRLTQSRLYLPQLGEFSSDQLQFFSSELLNLLAIGTGEPEKGPDVVEGKSEMLSAANEVQPAQIVLIVGTHTAVGLLRKLQQTDPLIIPDGLNIDAD